MVYVLTGLWKAFYIGFDALSASLHSASFNMHSALEHPHVVDDYIKVEVLYARVTGSVPTLPVPELHINPFGAIPKNH